MSRILAIVALSILVCFAAVPLGATTSRRVETRPAVTALAAPIAASQTRFALDVCAAIKSGLSADVLNLALGAVSCGVASGDLQTPPTLTLIDYSLPSTTPRLWVFDLGSGKLLFNELVAHGRNSGDNMATQFSDAMESRETSLGLFRTADTYVGHNGYSLRLDGLEPGFNGH